MKDELIKLYREFEKEMKLTPYDIAPPFPVFIKWLESKPKERWELAEGTEYFYPSLLCGYADHGIAIWETSFADQKRLAAGLVCRTEEEAEALAEKMLKSIKPNQESE